MNSPKLENGGEKYVRTNRLTIHTLLVCVTHTDFCLLFSGRVS